MNPRTGRPPSDNPRSLVLSVRVTADEATKLNAAAEAAGQPVTAWLRDRGLAAAKRARPSPEAPLTQPAANARVGE